MRRTWIPLFACGLTLSCDASNDGSSDDASSAESTEESGELGDDDDADDDDDDGGAECDIYAQDCPSGEKCVWTFAEQISAHRCVAVTGSKQLGESCRHEGVEEGHDDCDRHGMCYGALVIGAAYNGICEPFCQGSADRPSCEATTDLCTQGTLAVCLKQCDPLLQDCDTPEENCWFSPDVSIFVCSLASRSSGEAEDCIVAQDCEKGLTCTVGETVPGCDAMGCCAHFCALDDEQSCAAAGAGSECISLGLSGEDDNVGLCLLPE